jgi:hypothetical protein
LSHNIFIIKILDPALVISSISESIDTSAPEQYFKLDGSPPTFDFEGFYSSLDDSAQCGFEFSVVNKDDTSSNHEEFNEDNFELYNA